MGGELFDELLAQGVEHKKWQKKSTSAAEQGG